MYNPGSVYVRDQLWVVTAWWFDPYLSVYILHMLRVVFLACRILCQISGRAVSLLLIQVST